MGIYLNPGNAAFSEAVHSQIYVDKTELISYTNSVLATNQKNICVSRPRRFGKSIIIVRDVSLILYLKTEKSAVQKIIKNI